MDELCIGLHIYTVSDMVAVHGVKGDSFQTVALAIDKEALTWDKYIISLLHVHLSRTEENRSSSRLLFFFNN